MEAEQKVTVTVLNVFTGVASVMLEFHDADTNTDTDILARILADTSDGRFPEDMAS